MPHLDQLSDAVNNVRYSKNVDTVSNTNGKRLTEICVTSGLNPVNHWIYRDKMFDGNFTFKQKQNWISQIDWVVMSCRALPHLQEFKVLNALSLPTNHAPLSVELGSFTIPLFDIQRREKQLREAEPRKFHSRKRPLPMSDIDPAAFVEQLPDPESCWQLINDSLHTLANLNATLFCSRRLQGLQAARSSEISHIFGSICAACLQRIMQLLFHNDNYYYCVFGMINYIICLIIA